MQFAQQWRIYGGSLGGFKPPPPLGLSSKNLMCIEKRHHNVQTHTVCSYSTLSQAQPQTIGFKPPPPPPPPPPPWAAKWTCDMCIDARKTSLTGVQIANKIGSPLRGSWICDMCIDARKTSLTGVQNSTKKNRLAASRLVDDALHRRWVNTPPPLGKKLDPPLLSVCDSSWYCTVIWLK